MSAGATVTDAIRSHLDAERTHIRRRRRQVRSLYRRHPWFVLAALVTVAYFLAWPFVDYWLRGLERARPGTGPSITTLYEFYDWPIYSDAVARWQSGGDIYVQNDSGGYFGTYLYPPLVLWLFYPFVEFFSFRTGAMLWSGLSLVAMWIALQLVVQSLGVDLRWWERGLVLWALLGFQPLLFALKMGQTGGLLGALVCLAFVGLARQQRGDENAGFVSGGITAVVGYVKLAYAPVGAHLLEDADRLTGAVATGLVVLAASVGLFGLAAHVEYVQVLAWGASPGDPNPLAPPFWLSGYYTPLGWLPGDLAIRVGLSAAIAGTVALSRDRALSAFAVGAAAFPLLTPTTYTYYLVAVLPAGLAVTAAELQRDGRPALAMMGLLLTNAHAYGSRLFGVTLYGDIPVVATNEWLYYLLQPGIYGPAIIAGIAFARVAETARRPAWLDGSAGAESG